MLGHPRSDPLRRCAVLLPRSVRSRAAEVPGPPPFGHVWENSPAASAAPEPRRDAAGAWAAAAGAATRHAPVGRQRNLWLDG